VLKGLAGFKMCFGKSKIKMRGGIENGDWEEVEKEEHRIEIRVITWCKMGGCRCNEEI